MARMIHMHSARFADECAVLIVSMPPHTPIVAGVWSSDWADVSALEARWRSISQTRGAMRCRGVEWSGGGEGGSEERRMMHSREIYGARSQGGACRSATVATRLRPSGRLCRLSYRRACDHAHISSEQQQMRMTEETATITDGSPRHPLPLIMIASNLSAGSAAVSCLSPSVPSAPRPLLRRRLHPISFPPHCSVGMTDIATAVPTPAAGASAAPLLHSFSIPWMESHVVSRTGTATRREEG